TKLINNLLDVSGIAAGRLHLHLEAIDLAALAREVVSRHATELAQAGCAVTLCADSPVIGHWDRSRLDQVVTNLLSNAWKYGKGRPVEVTVLRDGASACLTVRDEGIGIVAADQARIFGLLERAVTSYEFGGLGLGL